MKVGTGSFRSAAIWIVLALMLVIPLLAGCGGDSKAQDETTAATDTAIAFLNALGDQDLAVLRSLMSPGYLDENGIPDPITTEKLVAVVGYVNSYRFIPDEDIAVEEDRAVVTVDLEVVGKDVREETLVLGLEDGGWKVDAFTAMDWSQEPVVEDTSGKVQVEQALRDFLVACVDGDTTFIFEHLSPDYKEKHRLEDPWTSAEFSGVFGSARSFDFAPEEIDVEDDLAEVDVTVEFGSRGNLESETSRVTLVREGRDWLVDVFPFFIY
ncbi:MAG: hypothetical protein JW854_16160 [Actinobacteria bacterium]|nr:hypothetical protein [Actinomycetota bacterium]